MTNAETVVRFLDLISDNAHLAYNLDETLALTGAATGKDPEDFARLYCCGGDKRPDGFYPLTRGGVVIGVVQKYSEYRKGRRTRYAAII